MRRQDQRRWLTAPLRARNYRAFAHGLTTWADPLDGFTRYLGRRADYPWRARLRTPLGDIEVLLPHAHDVRTVNEVFMRRDYGSDAPRVVVDIGANIGVSAAYFLTRRADSIVHCWEPHPRNLDTLRRNVAPFGDRVCVHDAALAPGAGTSVFVAEHVGRYSGLAAYQGAHSAEDEITVRCESVADELEALVAAHGRIDLLKIDTEGSEQALVSAVPAALWPHIGLVRYELPGHVVARTGLQMVETSEPT